MKSSTKHLLDRVSQDSIKAWLKTKDLKSTFDNRTSLITLLSELIDSDEISEAELIVAIARIEEYSGHTIYFFQCDSSLNSVEDFKNHMKNEKIKYVNIAEPALLKPEHPKVNYASYDEISNCIYVKFTETQIKVKYDAENNSYTRIPVTKVNVISLNLKTGVVSLRLNKPERVHSHKKNGRSSKNQYMDYYKAKATKLFKFKRYEAFDLFILINNLESKPDVFRLKNSDVVSDDLGGGKFYTSSKGTDVRDTAMYELMNEKLQDEIIVSQIKGYILKSDENGTKISRDIYVTLDGKASTLTYLSDCLPIEIEYALSFSK